MSNNPNPNPRVGSIDSVNTAELTFCYNELATATTKRDKEEARVNIHVKASS